MCICQIVKRHCNCNIGIEMTDVWLRLFPFCPIGNISASNASVSIHIAAWLTVKFKAHSVARRHAVGVGGGSAVQKVLYKAYHRWKRTGRSVGLQFFPFFNPVRPLFGLHIHILISIWAFQNEYHQNSVEHIFYEDYEERGFTSGVWMVVFLWGRGTLTTFLVIVHYDCQLTDDQFFFTGSWPMRPLHTKRNLDFVLW